MKITRSIPPLLIILGLTLGVVSTGPVIPQQAIAGENSLLREVFQTVRKAHRRGHIETSTFEELRESLRDARQADQDSEDYRAAIQNFRLLISSQTGLTISKDAAVRLFKVAADL